MFISSLLFGISASLDALLVGISYGIRRVRIHVWQNLAISLVALLGTCLSVGLGHRLASVLPDLISEYAGSLILIFMGLYYIVKWMMAHQHSLQAKAPPDTSQGAENAPVQNAIACQKSARPTETAPREERIQPPEIDPCKKQVQPLEGVPCKEQMQPPGAVPCQERVPSPAAAPSLGTAEVLSLSLTLSVNNLSAGFSASLAGLPLIPAAASTFLCSVLFLFSGNRLGGSHWLQLAGCAAEPVSGLLLIGLGAVQLFL